MSEIEKIIQCKFRNMVSGDFPFVIEIENKRYTWDAWSKGVFYACMSESYQRCVLQIDNKIIGFAITFVALKECHILNLCIDSDYRGFGYGKQLLNMMLQQAENSGARIFFLKVRLSNKVAINLYKRVDFESIGIQKKYYPSHDGTRENAMIMARSLQNDTNTSPGLLSTLKQILC